RIGDAPLFVALLLFSSLASALKVSLPLTKSGSSMSVSYAVDFAALLLLGADETMIVAGASAWSQCTFRMKTRKPLYRTLYWMALLTAAPVYLIYRTYKVYLGRVQDEQRHAQQVSDLHLATVEALALAIDAKDQTAQSHIRRVQVYAAGLARSLGMTDAEIQG